VRHNNHARRRPFAAAADAVSVRAQQPAALDEQMVKTAGLSLAAVLPDDPMAFALVFLDERAVDIVHEEVPEMNVAHRAEVPGPDAHSETEGCACGAGVGESEVADFPVFLVLEQERLVIPASGFDQRFFNLSVGIDDDRRAMPPGSPGIQSPREPASGFEQDPVCLGT